MGVGLRANGETLGFDRLQRVFGHHQYRIELTGVRPGQQFIRPTVPDLGAQLGIVFETRDKESRETGRFKGAVHADAQRRGTARRTAKARDARRRQGDRR